MLSRLEVVIHVPFSFECFATPFNRTFKRSLARMHSHVCAQVPRLSKAFKALVTLVRPFPRMGPHVDLQGV